MGKVVNPMLREDFLEKVSQKKYSCGLDLLWNGLTKEELSGFVKQKRHKPNPSPYVRFKDLNNPKEQDNKDYLRPHPAIEVGLEFSF